MIAAKLEQHGRMIVGSVPEPVCNDDELLIEVAACGVCGTDMHIFSGTAPSVLPLIPGHEFAGKVVSCGRKVKRFSIGAQVAVDPNIFCGFCEFCRLGKVHFCVNLQAIGVTRDGGFAQLVSVPESQVYELPAGLDLGMAAFAEPLSCCIHGMDVINVIPGDNVAIWGFGLIGAMMMQLARLAGAENIYVIESSTERQILAKSAGATEVFDPVQFNQQCRPDKEFTPGINVLIECAGHKDAFQQALEIAPAGSRLLMFGMAPVSHTVNLNLQSFFKKELILKSSLLNPFTFQRAVNMLSSGSLKLSALPVNRINLTQEEINLVFEKKRKESSLKSIISPLFY